ncbi:MAG: acyloxyacyl hydrolase [Bacteroidales bacterium]
MKFQLLFKSNLLLCLFLSAFGRTAQATNLQKDTLSTPTRGTLKKSFSEHFIQQISFEGRPEYIFPSNPFLAGVNQLGKPLRTSLSAHLKYSFQNRPNSLTERIYKGVYQGIGIAKYDFGNKPELGNPFAVYAFQGGEIYRLNTRLSLNYEWNFGISFGWHPFDEETNLNNIFIGSKMNAYMHAGFYFRWMVSPSLDFISGISLNHFSNGNTKYPNGGLNSAGINVGVVYNINPTRTIPVSCPIPAFERHISYDVVLFGSWRRKGIWFMDKQVASPFKYKVFGINAAALYNLNYRFRAGLSIDGVYDESCGVYTEDYIIGTEQQFYKAPLRDQFGLGISARGEYVMPYFTIGLGMGYNVWHKGNDMKGFYQLLALKMEVTRNSFIHVGYNLQNFHSPNYLMLGIGYRFNNKRQRTYRK